MNRSGEVLAAVLRRGRSAVREVVVVCDTLDLPAGQCRLRLRGSAGGQKGLESVLRHAGTNEVVRLVVGIGRPDPGGDVVSYVLGRPDPQQAEALRSAVEQAAEALLRLPQVGAERVMNEINRKSADQG
jgi:PTH1 family peptidyl-tRNA hydrolase